MPAYRYPNQTHRRKHGPQGYRAAAEYREWLRDEFLFRCVYCLERERRQEIVLRSTTAERASAHVLSCCQKSNNSHLAVSRTHRHLKESPSLSGLGIDSESQRLEVIATIAFRCSGLGVLLSRNWLGEAKTECLLQCKNQGRQVRLLEGR